MKEGKINMYGRGEWERREVRRDMKELIVVAWQDKKKEIEARET